MTTRPRVILTRKPPKGADPLPRGYVVAPRKSKTRKGAEPDRTPEELARSGGYPDHEGYIILQNWFDESLLTPEGEKAAYTYAAEFFDALHEKSGGTPVRGIILEDPNFGKGESRPERDAAIFRVLHRFASGWLVTGFGLYHGGCEPGPPLYRETDQHLRNLLKAVDEVMRLESAEYLFPWIPYVGFRHRYESIPVKAYEDIVRITQLARGAGAETVISWWDKLAQDGGIVTVAMWNDTIMAIEEGWC